MKATAPVPIPSEPLDVVRSTVNLALALAQPVAGRLAEFTGRGVSIAERSRAGRGLITPAEGAFAIWGPLFLASLVSAVRDATPERRKEPLVRRISGLLSLTYAGNTAWSLQAQFRGLGWPSVGIIAASAAAASAATITAARRASKSENGFLAAATAGPLAGWLTVAAFANLDITLNETRGRPKPAMETRRAVALIGAASGIAAAMALASRGNPGYAAAAGWGLGGIAVRNLRERNRAVVLAAGLGIAALAGAALPGGCLRKCGIPLGA